MTTHDRAREMAEEWHCRNCPDDLGRYTREAHTAVATAEIAAILDVLVEAKERLACHDMHDMQVCPWCGKPVARALIAKIDEILGDVK